MLANRADPGAGAILDAPMAMGARGGVLIIGGAGAGATLFSMMVCPGGGVACDAASLKVANDRAEEVFKEVKVC